MNIIAVKYTPNIIQCPFSLTLGTKDNCGGQCINSIRNLLPKRSKSLEEFTYEKNNENEIRSGEKIMKRPTSGWTRIRQSLKLQKYKLPIKKGKISYQVILTPSKNRKTTQITNIKAYRFFVSSLKH